MKKRVLFLILSALLLCSLLPTAVFAAAVQTIPEERQLPRLVDDADLLNESEEAELIALLDEISERQACDVAIVTVNSLDGKTATEYADDFYDYNGYGMGDGDDGIMLLVAMNDRQWAMTTYGFGIYAFTDAGQAYIADQFRPLLSDGEYGEAFTVFANYCDRFVTQARTGKPYDGDDMPKEPFSVSGSLILSLCIGVIGGFIGVTVMRSKLKSVSMKRTANDYTKNGSLSITDQREMFLYRNVTRREKPKEETNRSSTGSSTHVSSSGRSHGGSSGGF